MKASRIFKLTIILYYAQPTVKATKKKETGSAEKESLQPVIETVKNFNSTIQLFLDHQFFKLLRQVKYKRFKAFKKDKKFWF